MLQRFGFRRNIRVVTRALSDAGLTPNTPPILTTPNSVAAANCSYVADQLLLRITLGEAPAYIRLIRLLMSNPANANSVLLKRLTAAKRDLRWYNVWLRDVFIGADGINTTPTVPRDMEGEKMAHDALVKALMMATRYEQSSLLSGAVGGDAAAVGHPEQLKSAEDTVAKFFHAVPLSVSLELAGHIEDFALEKYRAEKLRNNMKKCCGGHTRALEPVLSHLGISIDNYTAAKIDSGLKMIKSAHNALFCELMEMLRRAEEHRAAHPEELATASMHEKVRVSLSKSGGKAAAAPASASEGDDATAGSEKPSKAAAARSRSPTFTARHCLKIGVRCVDVRTDLGSRGGRNAGNGVWAARQQASSAAIAQMVASYGSDVHPNQAVEVAAEGTGDDNAAATAASTDAPFAWNTGLFERYRSSAGVPGMPASRAFRDRFLNIPAKKLRSQVLLSTVADLGESSVTELQPAAPAAAAAEDSAPSSPAVALDREKNKLFLQNLPADVTAGELSLALQRFGEVQSVEIFCGEFEGTYSQLGGTSLIDAIERNKVEMQSQAQRQAQRQAQKQAQLKLQQDAQLPAVDDELDEEEEAILLTEGGLLELDGPDAVGVGSRLRMNEEDVAALFSGSRLPGGEEVRRRGVDPRLHEYLLTRSEDGDGPVDALSAGLGKESGGAAAVGLSNTEPRLTASPRNPIAAFSSMAGAVAESGLLGTITVGAAGAGSAKEGAGESDDDEVESGGKKRRRKRRANGVAKERPSKMMTQKLTSDCVAFVTMQDSAGFRALMTEEMKILGLNIRTYPVRVSEAQGSKVLIVEILNNLVVKRIVEVLSSIMGGWYEFRLMDNLEEFSNSHNAACVAYDKITAMMAISPNFPVRVHWHKTAWYHQVAAKARQMEYNAKRLVEGDASSPK